MGVSSTSRIRVPEERRRMVYVRIWTLTRFKDEGSSDCMPLQYKDGGVGARETLITCSRPGRHIESITSALKKSMRTDLSRMNRGLRSNRSDAKCIIGLCPSVDSGEENRFQIDYWRR
jgi:hypothetical protein